MGCGRGQDASAASPRRRHGSLAGPAPRRPRPAGRRRLHDSCRSAARRACRGGTASRGRSRPPSPRRRWRRGSGPAPRSGCALPRCARGLPGSIDARASRATYFRGGRRRCARPRRMYSDMLRRGRSEPDESCHEQAEEVAPRRVRLEGEQLQHLPRGQGAVEPREQVALARGERCLLELTRVDDGHQRPVEVPERHIHEGCVRRCVRPPAAALRWRSSRGGSARSAGTLLEHRLRRRRSAGPRAGSGGRRPGTARALLRRTPRPGARRAPGLLRNRACRRRLPTSRATTRPAEQGHGQARRRRRDAHDARAPREVGVGQHGKEGSCVLFDVHR